MRKWIPSQVCLAFTCKSIHCKVKYCPKIWQKTATITPVESNTIKQLLDKFALVGYEVIITNWMLTHLIGY